MIRLNINGTVDFEKGMEDWNLGRLTDYIDLNSEKKDAVCRLICQGAEIFKDDIISVVNKEIQKKSFGKNFEVKDMTVSTSGQNFFLTADVQVKGSQKAENMKSGALISDSGVLTDPYLPGLGLITWILIKAVSSAANNADKLEKILIKTINSKMINKKIMDAISSIMKEKKIPVEVKEITCC